MTFSSDPQPLLPLGSPPAAKGGKVYLVGSGLGSIDYLTVRAWQLLQSAEVIVYDALVDQELLQLAPPETQCIYVGKRGGQPSTPQAEIDQLLVAHCRSGKQIVRLKSGDPLIFGRAMSEILALQAAGCAFEIVPGISSALAAPLLAGIALTDAVVGRCFAVLSGHEPDCLNWPALATLDTLVILMGTQTLPQILDRLLTTGRSPDTPIALIQWAGRPQQQTWYGTLDTIAAQLAKRSSSSLSPAVIVIGAVVQLRISKTQTAP